MASPQAAGVAALIVSQFGKLGKNGDAVQRDYSARYDASAPFCPEYTE
jgi:hypothetical protein